MNRNKLDPTTRRTHRIHCPQRIHVHGMIDYKRNYTILGRWFNVVADRFRHIGFAPTTA